MRKITIHRDRHSEKWRPGITRSVYVLAALLLFSSLFISENAISQSGSVGLVAPVAGMRLDGHLKRQVADTGDWVQGTAPLNGVGTYLFDNNGNPAAPYNGAAYSGLIFHKIDLFNSQDDEGFDGGNKLFHDPNTWGWSSKKQLAKDDMNNSMVFITRDDDDHIWVLISGDRSSENGTSYLDFEFYKTSIAMTAANGVDDPVVGGKGRFVTAGPHGGRTIGDLSVTLSFTAGGTVAGVSFLQWQPGAEAGEYDYFSITPDPGDAWVAANNGIVDVPYGAFGSNTYAPNLFIEAAIDVTALIGDGTGDECAGLNFQSLFIKTKSSAERTADLKDFIAPFSISLCGDRTVPVVTPSGNPLNLGCNPSNGSIEGALGSATASDNCVTPTLTSSDGAIQSSGCTRSKTRKWTAIDGCGNTTTASRTATWVADATGPVITVSGNNSPLGCNPSASSINAALGSATASDGCSVASDITLTPSDGPVSSDGCSRSQTRKWTASDACGNTTTVSRTANWTSAALLTITCPADRQYQCTDANTSTTTAGAGVATTGGGCNPVLSATDQTTTRNCARLIRRTWRATDDCGQTATCVQNILIADNTPPQIQCVGGSATATDNCTAQADILLYQSAGVWTAVDGSGNIATTTCGAGRYAPTTNVVEETKPVVTEEEKVTSINSGLRQLPIASGKLEVFAYPNPYTDEVNFRFVSPQSGIGKLELYDMSGRQLKVINLGNVLAGVQRSVNYRIPSLGRLSMFYKLTVGDQTGNGTLVAGSKEP